jgi:hypothetical protein
MYRHHRHLELVAESKVADAAETYLEASAIYQTYTRSLYGNGGECLNNGGFRVGLTRRAVLGGED